MEKQIHPDDGSGYTQPQRESRGRYNMKFFLIAGFVLVVLGIALYFAAGIRNERANKEEPKGLQAATMTAKAAEPDARVEQPADHAGTTGAANPNDGERTRRRSDNHSSGSDRHARGEEKKERPKDFKVSTLVFGNKYMNNTINPLLTGSGRPAAQQASDHGGRSSGQGGRSSQGGSRGGGVSLDENGGGDGSESGEGYHSRAKGAKNDFYARGGGRSAEGLYHPYTIQPELDGCVLKAGDEIVVEARNPVRTELPGSVLGWVAEPAMGFIYHENGEQEECEAVPGGSRTMIEVNAGVSRGDLRVQMCAKQISLPGGIMPMDCSPILGQDGSSGVEGETDYQWGGVVAGILIESALSVAQSLGGLIEGPAGVAVNVGVQGIQGAGSRYIDRELNRPPVLTIKKGAIYKIQVNSDISFPVR